MFSAFQELICQCYKDSFHTRSSVHLVWINKMQCTCTFLLFTGSKRRIYKFITQMRRKLEVLDLNWLTYGNSSIGQFWCLLSCIFSATGTLMERSNFPNPETYFHNRLTVSFLVCGTINFLKFFCHPLFCGEEENSSVSINKLLLSFF